MNTKFKYNMDGIIPDTLLSEMVYPPYNSVLEHARNSFIKSEIEKVEHFQLRATRKCCVKWLERVIKRGDDRDIIHPDILRLMNCRSKVQSPIGRTQCKECCWRWDLFLHDVLILAECVEIGQTWFISREPFELVHDLLAVYPNPPKRVEPKHMTMKRTFTKTLVL